jgi:hypothetical protein
VYSILALFLAPTFWHDLLGQTAIHTVAIAALVAGIVQAIKRIAPGVITGRWVVITNTLLTIAGILAAQGTANFWTETTWAQIIVIVISASGIRNTTKTLTGLSTTPDPDQGASGIHVVTALAMFFALSVVGCGIRAATPATAPALPAGAVDSVDAKANQALQTIQAFMTPVVRDIQNGKLAVSPAQRSAVNTLDGLYNKAIVAEQGYHACMLTPGTTQTACLATSALTGALANAQGAFQAAQTAIAAAATP